MAVTKTRVSKSGVATAVSKAVTSIAPQARVAKSRVAVSVVRIGLSFSLRLGLSLPLGNVDGSNRVSTVDARGSIAIGDVGTNGGGGGIGSGNGGGGNSQGGSGVGSGVVDGRGGDGVSTSVAQARVSVEGLSLGL